MALLLSSFTLIKRLCSSSLLSAIRVVSSTCLRLLMFLLPVLIPAYNSSSLAFLMMCAACRLNKQGDSRQPYCTPFSVFNQSVVPYRGLLLLYPHTGFSGDLMVWYSHLSKSFPQFVMIHTAKGFSIVMKQRYMFLWNSLVFSIIQQMLAIWSLVPLPFLNSAWTSRSPWFT